MFGPVTNPAEKIAFYIGHWCIHFAPAEKVSTWKNQIQTVWWEKGSEKDQVAEGAHWEGLCQQGLWAGRGGRCWTEVPLLHKVEGNWHYLAIPPLPSQSQKDSSIAICCLYKLKSVSWGKLCTQHALKTSVLVKLSEIIMNQQEKNSCAWVDRLHHTPVFNRWTIKSSGMGPWGVWISGQTIDYV